MLVFNEFDEDFFVVLLVEEVKKFLFLGVIGIFLEIFFGFEICCFGFLEIGFFVRGCDKFLEVFLIEIF